MCDSCQIFQSKATAELRNRSLAERTKVSTNTPTRSTFLERLTNRSDLENARRLEVVKWSMRLRHLLLARETAYLKKSHYSYRASNGSRDVFIGGFLLPRDRWMDEWLRPENFPPTYFVPYHGTVVYRRENGVLTPIDSADQGEVLKRLRRTWRLVRFVGGWPWLCNWLLYLAKD